MSAASEGSSRRRGLIAACSIVLVGAAAFLAWPRSVAPEAPITEELSESTEASASRLGADAGARTPLPGGVDPARSGSQSPSARGTGMTGLVSGVVLAAEDGRPLAGAEVSLCGWPRSDAEVAAYRRPLRWNDPPAQVTGPDGRFAFAFATAPLPPLGWDLFVHAPQRATGHRRWHQLDADRGKKPCEIKLSREFSVRARTVTERGEPAANACVELSTQVAPSKPGGGNVHVRAVSDAGGNLDFAALPVGEHTATTSNAGAWRIVGWTKLVVGNDGIVQGDRIVVTALDAKIEGRVVDDAGSAQPGVEVIATTVELHRGGHLGKATTDAEGRFVVWRHRDAEPGAALRLMLADETTLAPAPSWNAPARDFVAPRCGSVQLRVVDAEGKPVQRFAVEWLGGHKPEGVGSVGGHHPRGEADLGACAAGMTYLDVLPGGQDLGRAGIVRIDVAPASAQTVTVKLTPPVRRTVRVATSDGSPVVGANVAIAVLPPGVGLDRPADPMGFKRSVVDGVDQRPFVLLGAKTSAEGQVEVLLPASLMRYSVTVSKEQLVTAVVLHELDARTTAVIDVVLNAGATFRGRVMPVDIECHLAQLLRATANQVVVVARPAQLDAANSDRRAEQRGALHDGAFVLFALEPGAWDLAFENTWSMFGAGLPFARIQIADGAEREQVFEVHHLVPGSLSGRVLIDGAPASAAKVRLVAADWQSATITTDVAGNFRVEAVLPGRRWLHADDVGLDPDPIEFASGVNLEHTFHPGGVSVTVKLRLDDGTFVREGMFRLCLEPGGLQVAYGRSQGDNFVFDRVAAGHYSVRKVAFPGQQELRGTLDVPAGVPSVECEVTLRVVAPSSPR